MGRIRDRMAKDLEIAGYKPSTQRIYLVHARRFVAHFQRSPEELGADHVREFLFHLIENHRASRQTVRQVRAALRFLYAVTLRRPLEVDWIPPGRLQKPLPVILSPAEVAALLEAVRQPTRRAVLTTMYAAGLRIREACRLLPEDVHSQRMLIHVRCGKGSRDRYTILSPRLLQHLRQYWQNHRSHVNGYLFPGGTRLGHVSLQSVRKGFRQALQDTDIRKDVTPHVLRHCFATHLLQSGHDVTIVQALLGHQSVRTTERYTHVRVEHVARIRSPLDALTDDQTAVLA